MASASMPMPMRSSEWNSSMAWAWVNDITNHFNAQRPVQFLILQ
jgi:hypothetical protein